MRLFIWLIQGGKLSLAQSTMVHRGGYKSVHSRVLLDGRNICAGEMLGGADTCLGKEFTDRLVFRLLP